MAAVVQLRKPRERQGCARFITLKRKGFTDVSFVEDHDMVTTNPTKASEQALKRLQASFGISKSQALFTIASYSKGHYLIYDNSEIVAHTIINL